MSYMVVYANLFENTIEAEQVSAESDWQAILKSSFAKGITVDDNITLEGLKQYFFDCDGLINVFLIKQLS